MKAGDTTVIVPVYDARAEAERCLQALLPRLEGAKRLLLIDDASTDPAILPLLRAAVRQAPIPADLLQNPDNLGFVATVNRAAAACDGDFVLLNSDTRVSRGWLPALIACASRDATVASVTPFSNHAEICSLPLWLRANPIPEDLDAVAAALAALADEPAPELPTAVGFCMWIRRRAWQDCGDFDAATFGRGYGEENDWCRRTAGFGWKHVLCPAAYVAHVGHASFAAVGEKPGGRNLARLLARYPDYARLVDAYIAADPCAGLRQRAAARAFGTATPQRPGAPR